MAQHATLSKVKTKTSYVSLNERVLNLFNKAFMSVADQPVYFKTVSQTAVKLGYLVHPSICNQEVYDWLIKQDNNYNSTFYKSWNHIITKSRFELYIDQIKHYASTYGTDYAGEVYLPEGEVTVPEFTKFKVILPISKEEIISRCEQMLFNGIALKQETIEDIVSIFNSFRHKIDVEKVKNKEARIFLFKETNTVPNDPIEMVRYLTYLATEKTLLIKDKETIEKIKSSYIDISQKVKMFGAEKLSSVFLRFKPIFLAFRTNHANKVCVNELRRLAKKNHKPLETGYFEKLLSSPETYGDLEEKLQGITNFKKVTLLQAISVRLKELENRAFVVRNQKLYIKEGDKKSNYVKRANNEYFSLLYDVIYQDLVKSVSKNKCSVRLPKGINLTLPTSEKSFIGNYPVGTSFDFSDSDNIFGIYWRGEDGASDLDLKMIDIDGKQYGWNAAYKNSNNSIVFSGDMTSANPEATELFYTSKGFNPCIVKVNLFSGSANSKFKFFLAKEKVTNMSRGYMVNPNNIIVNVDCEMDSSEKTLGVMTDSKFILAQFRTGKGKVAGDSVTNQYTDYALKTLDCYVNLESLLTDAGFTISDTNAAIDLTDLSKDTLINLLSN